jgi:uncharacterized heparinase superfamily protein
VLPPPADPPASKAFADGGFFVLRAGATHVFVDCGNVGMLGLGGHGHNDILSFELVLDGVPLVTDSGTFVYTASKEWRNRFRSTAFHATVQIDGEELNRYISPDMLWRLQDDAQPEGVRFERTACGDRFRGSHTGYLRLADPVRVTREIVLARDARQVAVRDTLEGTGRHDAVWRFPLDPTLRSRIDGGDVCCTHDGRDRWFLLAAAAPGLRWTLEPGWVSPSYGVRRERLVLTAAGSIELPYRLTYLFSTAFRSTADRAADVRALGLD